MNADLRGLVRDLMPALDAYEMAGRRSYHKDGALHWEMTAQYWEAQRLRERAEAALSVAQGQGWRPIESAPRDGTAVLIACFSKHRGDWRVCESQWLIPFEGCAPEQGSWGLIADRTRCTLDASIHRSGGATHWQPLPAAPAQPDGVSK